MSAMVPEESVLGNVAVMGRLLNLGEPFAKEMATRKISKKHCNGFNCSSPSLVLFTLVHMIFDGQSCRVMPLLGPSRVRSLANLEGAFVDPVASFSDY